MDFSLAFDANEPRNGTLANIVGRKLGLPVVARSAVVVGRFVDAIFVMWVRSLRVIVVEPLAWATR